MNSEQSTEKAADDLLKEMHESMPKDDLLKKRMCMLYLAEVFLKLLPKMEIEINKLEKEAYDVEQNED